MFEVAKRRKTRNELKFESSDIHPGHDNYQTDLRNSNVGNCVIRRRLHSLHFDMLFLMEKNSFLNPFLMREESVESISPNGTPECQMESEKTTLHDSASVGAVHIIIEIGRRRKKTKPQNDSDDRIDQRLLYRFSHFARSQNVWIS